MGRVFILHAIELGSIPGTTYSSPSLLGIIPEGRARSNTAMNTAMCGTKIKLKFVKLTESNNMYGDPSISRVWELILEYIW